MVDDGAGREEAVGWMSGILGRSVFVRQQERRRAAVGFRDDPELHARAESIAGKNSPAMFEAEFVFKAVVLVEFAPIPRNVTNEKGQRVIPTGLKRG